MRKKIITNLTIIGLLFILVFTIFKINRIKLYRADGSLLFVKTLKSNSVYNEGDTVVVKDKFGNYVITNIFIDNNDGTYLTKKETSNYMDNFKSTSNNIMGLYSFRLKHFFSFWESKFVRFIFLLGLCIRHKNKSVKVLISSFGKLPIHRAKIRKNVMVNDKKRQKFFTVSNPSTIIREMFA